jgi:hypothetical protein
VTDVQPASGGGEEAEEGEGSTRDEGDPDEAGIELHLGKVTERGESSGEWRG